MMNIETSKCVIFEDSEVGLQAARAAGSYVVRVTGENAVNFKDIDNSLSDMQI